MKYRTVATNSDEYPFKVQRKNDKFIFPYWKNVTRCKSHHEAFHFMRTAMARHLSHPSGSVVLEYDESDLVVEKLKNQSSGDRAEGAQTGAASTMTMAMSGLVSKAHLMKEAGLNVVNKQGRI